MPRSRRTSSSKSGNSPPEGPPSARTAPSRSSVKGSARKTTEDLIAERFEKRWEEKNSRPAIDDPRGWARRKLRTHLWSKQVEIMESVRDRRKTAVKSCHSAGKSFTAATLAVWWIDAHPPGEAFVVTSAPTGDQVKAILWREINRAHRRGELPGRLNLTEWYDETGELIAFGRKPSDTNPTAFQGIHARFVLVILDEACGIPELLWHAADSLTSNKYGRTVAIGNPDDPNSYFATVCQTDPTWHTIRISAFDTPNFTGEADTIRKELIARPLNPKTEPNSEDAEEEAEAILELLVAKEWVEEKRTSWGEDSPIYISKVLGEFPTDATDGIIPYTWAKACQYNEENPPDLSESTFNDHVKQGGFDVSGSERGDKAVLWVRNGPKPVRKYEYRTADPEELANWAHNICEMEELDYLVVDSIGVGWGVIGALRILGANTEVIAFNASESAIESEKFANKRAELWWNTGRESSRKNQWDLTDIDDDTLDELTKPRYKTSTAANSKGKIIVELKDDIRERLGRSPDSADALLLAFSPAWGSTVTFGSYTAQRRMSTVR